MLISVIFLAVLHTCSAHVVLTYPPARRYALDFLDNARTRPPCGVPRGYGPVTELKAGSTVTVTWHIAFPHQGGFYLEILDSNDRPVIRYEQSGQVVPEPEPESGSKPEAEAEAESTAEPESHNPGLETTGKPEPKPEPKPEAETTGKPEPGHEPEPGQEPEPTTTGRGNVGYIGHNDTTQLMYTITLPNMECRNCTLRLIRQALEWGVCSAPYLFWSCSDIDVVTQSDKNDREKCSNHGTWRDGNCFCDPMYEGNMCQYKDDCESAEHCNNHGMCEDTMATSYPKRQCYCDIGWFGRNCQYQSSVRSRNINYGLYEHILLGADFNLYYRELKVEEEMEVVMRVRTNTWIGLGWKPTDFRSGCQLFPALPGVNIGPHAEPETTGEPEHHAEPETTSEPENHAQPETTAEPEHQAQPETTAEPEHHAEPETTSEPETHGEPESTSEPENHAEPEGTGEPGSNVGLPPCNGPAAPISFGEPTPEGEPTSESEPKSEGEPKPTGEPETTAEPNSNAEPKSEHEPKAENQANAENQPNSEHEPNAENEPTPEGEPSGGFGTGYPTATVRGKKQGAPTHGMDCTDMVVGSAKGQRSRIGDYYTRDRSTPQYDDFYGGMNSLTAALGYEEGEYTVILFRKKIKAKEPSDHDFDAAPMTVIWAKGQKEGMYSHQFQSGLDVGRAGDEMFYRKDELKYHGHRVNRGTATINFRERTAPPSGCSGQWPAVCNNCPYQAMWEQDLANDMVNFTIRARLGGERKWIGLGFSNDRLMTGSDAVIGWVDGATVHVSDRYLSGYRAPDIDNAQNLAGISGSLVNGVTEIKFSRRRSTGDSNDFQFTDTECPYLLYAVGGGYDASNVITRHATTPVISAQKVCFSTTCATRPRGVKITTYVSLRFPKIPYISAYGNKMSREYKELSSELNEWVKFKLPITLASATVVNLKRGSVVADFRVDSWRPDNSDASKRAHEADVRDFFNSIKTTGSMGDYEVDPAYNLNQRDMEDKETHYTGLTLVEKIVIGVSVALCVIGLIVCVCKIKEMRDMRSSSSHKKKYALDDSVHPSSLEKGLGKDMNLSGHPDKRM